MKTSVSEENAAMDALRAALEINYKRIQPCSEFQRLANKLGTVFIQPLRQIDIEECLRDNAIDVYPLEAVRDFMTKKAATATKSVGAGYKITWSWHPLRAVDRDRPAGIGHIGIIYDKPVPVEVLMTVEKLSDLLGQGARFYVADLVRVRLPQPIDPFLCITAHDCPLYVIERWDEPAFRS